MTKFHYKDAPSEKQKKSFSSYLSEDEELILVTGFSQAYIRQSFILYLMFPGMVFGSIGFIIPWTFKINPWTALSLGLILMIASATIKTMHLYHANRYLLTTRRIMIKRGLFAVNLTVALFDKITHLEVVQGFMDRLFFHHGDIIINTAGMSKDEIILKYVDYPIEVKNLLERLINREREQMGSGAATLTEVEGEIIS
jgi:membrane protein YdbS with pleckstrin-like domain